MEQFSQVAALEDKSVNPGYYGTVGSGRLCSFSDHFLVAGFRSESDGKEPAGICENCAGIKKSCTEFDSDSNGSSHRNDRPGIRCFRTNHMKVKLSDTGFFENVNKQANLFYHGTISEYTTQILESGIPGDDSFISSDFGPGYYLNTSFTDARDWLLKRIRGVDTKLDAVFIYKIDMNQFNIWNLSSHGEHDDNDALLNEWRKLIKLCRQKKRPFQLIYQYDGVFDSQCANPADMFYLQKEPRIRRIQSSEAKQLCVSSSKLKSKLYRDLLEAIDILDPSTSN
ncbi:unnamed protein product [Adineta ricciae]|nr:unnamed protein product [Adineta ricciae]